MQAGPHCHPHFSYLCAACLLSSSPLEQVKLCLLGPKRCPPFPAHLRSLREKRPCPGESKGKETANLKAHLPSFSGQEFSELLLGQAPAHGFYTGERPLPTDKDGDLTLASYHGPSLGKPWQSWAGVWEWGQWQLWPQGTAAPQANSGYNRSSKNKRVSWFSCSPSLTAICSKMTPTGCPFPYLPQFPQTLVLQPLFGTLPLAFKCVSS